MRAREVRKALGYAFDVVLVGIALVAVNDTWIGVWRLMLALGVLLALGNLAQMAAILSNARELYQLSEKMHNRYSPLWWDALAWAGVVGVFVYHAYWWTAAIWAVRALTDYYIRAEVERTWRT